MPNIRVYVGYTIKDGTEIMFRSPVDCSAITGLIVYYPGADSNTTSKVFALADAHGNNVGDIDHLFAENVMVKVILDVTNGMAFVQNADTNAYLEGMFAGLEEKIRSNTIDGKKVPVFEEQALSFGVIWERNYGRAENVGFNLVPGESYVVIFDGEEYFCECYEDDGDGGGGFVVGSNPLADTKEYPFYMGVVDNTLVVIAHDTEETHRVAICRYVSLSEDLLPDVDATHNGMVLSVVGGKWTAAQAIDKEAFAQMQQDIADLKYVPIDITKLTDSVVTVEMGTVVNDVTVSWTLNKEPVNQTLDGESVEVSARSKAFTGLALSANKTFTLVVTDERGATDSASTAISFLNGVYYGVLEDGAEVDSAAVLTLTRKLQGSKGITFTANAGAAQRIAYVIPTRYGTPNFNVGGFDGGFAKAKTFDFTNASGYTESYDVWLSENVNLGSTTVKVS